MTKDKDEDTQGKDKDLLGRALDHFDDCHDLYDKDYKQGEEDNDFLQGDPWPAAIRAEREAKGRPCLNISRLQPFVHQVENEIRQSRPAIKVSPVDDKGDIETARIIKGVIRNIETVSGADNVYDRASANAIRTGYGWIRVNTRYESERSFNQVIEILEVFDPFSVYLGPHKKIDGSDAEYGFVFERMSREKFKAEYPDADPVSFENYGSTRKNWCDEKEVVIAEYFYKDWKKTTLYLLPGNRAVTTEEAEEQGIDVSMIAKEYTRETRIPVIKWIKLTAAEVLERTDWPGKYIPLVPVYGDLIIHEGKRKSRSLIYHAKDSARLMNYMRSASAEIVALQPKAPFIGPKGSFRSFMNKWRRANIDNEAVLEYDPVFVTDPATKQTVLAPAPVRQMPPQGSAALLQEGMIASDDIKAALGMFAPSLGEQGDEKSGKAILARQQQGNNATFHFMDNLSTAIRQVGRILVDLIPRTITGPQMLRIIGDDGNEENVRVNEQFMDPKTGKPVLYDLTAGDYDVTVSVGPAYATKRIESVNVLVELIRANPQIAPVVMPTLFKNLDFAEADDIAKKLQAQLPPEMNADDPNAVKLQKADQAIQALTAQIEQMDQALKSKEGNEQAKMELEARKLELENKKLDLEAMKLQMGAIQTAQQAAQPKEGSGEPSKSGGIDPKMQEIIASIFEAIQEIDSNVRDVGQAVDILLSEDEEQATAEPLETAA